MEAGVGVMDEGAVGDGRSLACCRTGLLADRGAENGFNFGMLFWTFFSS